MNTSAFEKPKNQAINRLKSLQRNLLFFAAMCLIPLTLVGRDMWRYFQNQNYQTYGVVVQGVVTDKEESHRGDDNFYALTYSYSAEGVELPKEFTIQDSVSASLYRSKDMGGPISIVYDSRDPRISKIEGTGENNWIGSIGAGVMLMFLCLLGLQTAKKIGVAKELEERGLKTQGKIFEKWVESEDEKSSYYIAYQYASQKGMVPLSRKEYNRLQTGDVIDVLYLPNEPEKHTVVVP